MELVPEFEQLWNPSNAPPDVFAFLRQHDAVNSDQLIGVLLFDQRRRWRTDAPLKVAAYVKELSERPLDMDEVLQLIVGEQEARNKIGQTVSIHEISSELPEISEELRERLSKMQPDRSAQHDGDQDGCEPVQADSKVPDEASSMATYITKTGIGVQEKGRYRLGRVLGEGAFGRVYLAFDEELRRQVAIKVPTKARFQKPEDAEAYLEEARNVAKLDHANIVPVFDVGRTGDGSIYVVSKFIDGCTLADQIKAARPAERESAQLLSTVAQALQNAHERRLIHRDVKPANILLEDKSNNPYVADFGLAIREEDYLQKNVIAGTPEYMSPEQARGEGHLLTGRSDIFSLGVILYELLTGKRPFRGSSVRETLDQVKSKEPQPPRDMQDSISAELERICLKALSKRVSDRHATAAEFAEDLEQWLNAAATDSGTKANVPVVPRGLRSFDADDADFFLDLLPGPRNRDGLPESISFWKQRIEQTDPEKTFRVGLIYGPSGCGKSSLVKAGLLPHLSDSVIAVYVESTAEDTETRILRSLRKRLPELVETLSLTETLATLRRGQEGGAARARKVVIIIDQFEQWLHAHRAEPEAELVAALRQCDGDRLQAIGMVRDDFAMAAARFMHALDIPIRQGENFATFDLFDVDHAQKVLSKFGQAFGKLPAGQNEMSVDEQRFVSDVATGLAQEGQVVSVRLSLFAEMVKGKPWTPATLKQVGGTAGIGVNFLEETFSSRQANPRHRLHASAARGVLKALLPDLGTDIKGHMRSQDELIAASGYQGQPSEFADLLRILDSELRLITPTEPEGDSVSGSSRDSSLATRCYQLTHDYLVPSLREWLTRKQKETRKGRAELTLAERSSLWNAKPENRHLPSLREWLSIRTLTESKHWPDPDRTMMSRAFRVLGLRTGLATAAVLTFMAVGIVVWGRVLQRQEATRIQGLVGRLVSAEPAQIPEIVKELDVNHAVAATYLSPLVSADAKTADEKRSQMHARLATVSRDQSLVEPLLEELLTNNVAYIGPIRQQLRPYAPELKDNLWAILRNGKAEANRRFRAAVALADYIPESEAASWTEQDLQFVAEQLVSDNPEFQQLLRENLRPVSGQLLEDLETIFGDAEATAGQRLSAANAFADYAASDIPKLSRLLTVATKEQFAVLYPLVAATPAPSTVDDLGKIAATLPATELGSVERVSFGQRRANAAVTLLRLGEPEKVLPVFEMTDDPEALTQFIFRCRDRDVRVEELLHCLRIVSDRQVDRYPRNTRYALLLALGEFALDDIPESQREALLTQLGDWYSNDPSSGVHGAAGWLMRQWGQSDMVRELDQTPVPYSDDREWFTLAITVTPTISPKPTENPSGENADPKSATTSVPPGERAASRDESTGKRELSERAGSPERETKPESPHEPFPASRLYYTFIVFRPGEYLIGSVGDESDRKKNEIRHQVQFTRPFALLDREITFDELILFSPQYMEMMQQYDANPEDAAFGADWYDSVGFCRWLSRQSGMSESDQCYADPGSLDKEKYPREPNPEANWAPRDWTLDMSRSGFRLPTESEWEFASRVGVRSAFGFGSDASFLARFGWFVENSSKHVHPPRQQRPGFRGMFDLHGNLYEWTHDWYGEFSNLPSADPMGAKAGSLRVLRGGGWSIGASLCRSAARGTLDPAFRSNYGGFRLALSPSGGSIEVEKDK